VVEVHKLVRVGGSWAVTIPPAILRYLGIRPRDLVTVSLMDHSIVIRKLDRGKLSVWATQEEEEQNPVKQKGG